MNRVYQHIPASCDGLEPQSGNFETTDELLSIPWIAKWSKEPDFFRFSKSDRHLMLELDSGKKWWVLGYLGDPSSVDLPTWIWPGKTQKG